MKPAAPAGVRCAMASLGALQRNVRPITMLLVASAVALGACTDGAPAAVDATTADAGTDPGAPGDAGIDASTTGTLVVTWQFRREGVLDPVVPCAELGAVDGDLSDDSGPAHRFVAVACEDHVAQLDQLVPGIHDVWLAFYDGPVGNRHVTSGSYRASVEVRAGATTLVPFELRLFDEPDRQLAQLAAGAIAHYQASPEPRRFPTASGVSATCCVAPGGICPPAPGQWTQAPFAQLGFHVDGPSRFAFRFASSGTGAAATFRAEAIADYDCDGDTRAYHVDGRVAADGSVVTSAVIVDDDVD